MEEEKFLYLVSGILVQVKAIPLAFDNGLFNHPLHLWGEVLEGRELLEGAHPVKGVFAHGHLDIERVQLLGGGHRCFTQLLAGTGMLMKEKKLFKS